MLFCQDMQHFVFWPKYTGSCFLITWVFFGISKFFWYFFCLEGPLMLHVKLGANRWNCLWGVWKSMFFIFCYYRDRGRGIHHTIQLNSGNTWQVIKLHDILRGSYLPKIVLCWQCGNEKTQKHIIIRKKNRDLVSSLLGP